jgi:cytochrome b561
MQTLAPKRYNNTAIVLHWLLALLIIGLLVVVFYAGPAKNTLA